jgi:hypothetical protein
MMLRKFSLLSFLFAAPMVAQTTTAPTWFTITQENPSVSVTLPAGTTYRFGDTANNRWAQVTVNQTTTISPVSMAGSNPFPFSDPDNGVVKELDILETATAQTISVTNSTATPATVAMVVPSTAPATVVDGTPGSNHTLTFTNFSVAPGSTQNALMFAFVNQPSSNANRTWEGTQMNLTIDGVNLVCSYGQTYTDGVFTLSCTVPATSAASTMQTATTATP